jgi:hypothetical protein
MIMVSATKIGSVVSSRLVDTVSDRLPFVILSEDEKAALYAELSPHRHAPVHG